MSATAPAAPGSLTQPVGAAAMLAYLDALADWLRARRTELDELDEQVLRSPEQERLTPDVALSMALWQSVAERHELLLATWDSGRVGAAERQRLAVLVWGRLEAGTDGAAGGTGLEVSVPEACRLSDALVGQLRARLSPGSALDDPTRDQQHQRVRTLRAQLERIRDQVALEPAPLRPRAEADLAALQRRLTDVAERAARGGDVGGLLGPLEHDAATGERDLIVAGARRRRTRDQRQRALDLRSDLEQRAEAVRQLVRRTVEEVDPAPRYAVPDVTVLGPVPDTGLQPYLDRLEQVERAVQLVQRSYSAALARLADARGRFDGYRAKVTATGLAGHPVVGPVTAGVQAALDVRPCPVELAETLLAGYARTISWYAPAAAPDEQVQDEQVQDEQEERAR